MTDLNAAYSDPKGVRATNGAIAEHINQHISLFKHDEYKQNINILNSANLNNDKNKGNQSSITLNNYYFKPSRTMFTIIVFSTGCH